MEYVVNSLDMVEEGIRGAYVEADGKFNFDADKYAELKAAGLKKKNGELIKTINDFKPLKERTEKYKPIIDSLANADEEELAEFLLRWQKRGEGDDKKKADPNSDASRQLEMLNKVHAKELKKREDELAQLKSDAQKAAAELREYELWTPLREIAIKNGVNPDDWELARLDLGNQRRFGFDEDKKIVVMEDGSPSSVTPEKFFKDVYSDQRPKFYKQSGAAGSGAPNSSHGGKSAVDLGKLPPSERLKAAREAGFTK